MTWVYGSSHVGLRRVLTYGTYDLLHYGHIRLLQRAASLGDYLIVALSTDEFNALKGKKSFYSYEVRREMLEAIRYVDLVIPETHWEKKASDVERYCVDVVCMGGDWKGRPSLRGATEPVRGGVPRSHRRHIDHGVKGRLGKDSL